MCGSEGEPAGLSMQTVVWPQIPTAGSLPGVWFHRERCSEPPRNLLFMTTATSQRNAQKVSHRPPSLEVVSTLVSSPVRCQEARNALPTAIPRAPPSLPSGSAGNKREQSCSTPLTWPCSDHSTQHRKTCAALDVRLHLRLCVCPGLCLRDPHMHVHLLHYTVDP